MNWKRHLAFSLLVAPTLSVMAGSSIPRQTPGPARAVLAEAQKKGGAAVTSITRLSTNQEPDALKTQEAVNTRLAFAEAELSKALSSSQGEVAGLLSQLAAFPREARDSRWADEAIARAAEALGEKPPLRAVRMISREALTAVGTQPSQPLAGFKQSTGWILDARVYDPTIMATYPGVLQDLREYDEGGASMGMGADGWVWQVHSFRWTEITADHPAASECLALYVSPDGGATWYLYTFLYDTAAKDLVNPSMALDITPTYERLFIAYEYAKTPTDHDVYVYSETSELGGGTANPQDAAIATSALHERNPVIASDYTSGQTSYRLVVWEQEYTVGGADYDLFARQSSGAGAAADWASAVSIAATGAYEGNPNLSAGASGGVSFTQYMHLAYNYDTFSSQLLLNPGFESGRNGQWVESSSGGYNIVDNTVSPAARTGNWKAWLGGYNSANDTLYQQVAIPAGSAPVLTFYLRIDSAELVDGTPWDYLNVRVRSTTGTLLGTLATFTDEHKNAYASYGLVTLSLSSFAGQTVRVCFETTTDTADVSSFLLDDTAVTLAAGHEIRYARATHPGATPYPQGLQASAKTAVLTNVGAEWVYGPPSIVASHGGSATMTPSRVVVAADQWFPANSPTAGDPARYQVCYAWNTCNGSTTCGTLTCSPSNLSLNWVESYIYEAKADSRFPSLIGDGSGLWDNGIARHPLLFMAYYQRDQSSPKPYGQVRMVVTDASDETCTGFPAGGWFYFTASSSASDEDDLAFAQPRTVVAFNYWDGYPGVGFHKKVTHYGGTENLDPYFTTIGENYFFDTLFSGSHVDASLELDGSFYSSPYTFPWAAGYNWTVSAQKTVIAGRLCPAISWSDGTLGSAITIPSDFCDGVTACPTVSYSANYGTGCLVTQPEVAQTMTLTKAGSNAQLSWPQAGAKGDADHYTVLRSVSPVSASQFSAIASVGTNGYTDTEILPNPVVYYLVTAGCGPYEGPWGAYGQ